MGEQHHIYGASSMGRRFLCPGSARMARNAPEVHSKDADEGTLLHLAIHDDKTYQTLDDEQREMVDRCRVLRDAQVEELRALPPKPGLPEYNGITPTVFSEWKVKYELPRLGMWIDSTLDCAILPVHSYVKAAVLEWKMGHGEPNETAITFQGSCYALGLYEYLTQYQCVEVTIYYPRLERKYRIEVRDFERVRARIEEVVEACEAPGAPLVPGHEQCQFCRALVSCPAARSALQVVTSGTQLPVSPAEMAKRLEFGQLAEKWYERQKEVARELIAAGMEIPGYGLITRKGAQYVADVRGACMALDSVMTAEEFEGCVDVKLTRLKELYAAKVGAPRKESDRQLEQALSGVLKRRADITYIGRTRKE